MSRGLLNLAASEEDVPQLYDSGLACASPALDVKTFFLRVLPVDIGYCLVIAVVLSLVVTPFMAEGSFTWFGAFQFSGIVSICIGLTVANTFRFLLPPLKRRFAGPVANVVLHAGLGLAATALGVEVAIHIIEGLGGMPAAGMRINVFRVGLIVAAVAIALDVTYERLRRRARRDELRAEQASKEALRAQLRALQARTNPHFLFNSLNTVSGLIEEDPEGAERVLGRLSDLFRYALKSSEASWVRLEDEIAAVESYLEVESIRLGDRLRSKIDVLTEIRGTLVPPLLLQPLVENAVLHGVAPRKAGGCVEVAAERVDDVLCLSVTDDGRGPGSSPHRGSGTSLSEMAGRLEMIYGDAASLDAGSRHADGTGYRVEVHLPLKASA